MLGITRAKANLPRPAEIVPRVVDPWTEMTQMRQDLDDFVARAFGFTPLGRMMERLEPVAPPVELYETEGEYELKAQLPGLALEDIHVEATGNAVHIWGEHRTQAPADGAKVHVNTAAYGRFEFRYELPVEIRADEVKATYRDGILEVLLPKVEVIKPKTVQVEIGK